MAPTVPYYRFREVLSVRETDASRFRTLADLRGRRIGTLGGTIAYEILLRAEREFGIKPVSYDDDVHPYTDLVIGRVNAVLLDTVLAERCHRTISGFTIQPESVATGHYVGVLAARNAALRESVNEILRNAMRDGTLERIFRKWRVWNEDQPALFADVLAGNPLPPVPWLRFARRRSDRFQMADGAGLPARAFSRRRNHDGAFMFVDGAGHHHRCVNRQWTRLRRQDRPLAFNRVCRDHPRNAYPSSAFHLVLRYRRTHSPTRRCCASWARTQLCRIRK
jgi:Bacterial extracellular solute-binding proteins, family 3